MYWALFYGYQILHFKYILLSGWLEVSKMIPLLGLISELENVYMQ